MARRRAFGVGLGPRQSTQRQQELEDKIPGGPVTPEFRSHHPVKTEVIATDKLGFATLTRQSVRSKFLNLVEQGDLTLAEGTAALQLRTYADQYYRGTTGAWQMRVDGGSRPGESIVGKLHYATQVQAALDYLNPELRRIACAWILEAQIPELGSTFVSIGRSYLPTVRDEERCRAAGKALVIAVCRSLATFFKMQDSFQFDPAAGATGLKAGRIRKMRLETPQEPQDGQTQGSGSQPPSDDPPPPAGSPAASSGK